MGSLGGILFPHCSPLPLYKKKLAGTAPQYYDYPEVAEIVKIPSETSRNFSCQKHVKLYILYTPILGGLGQKRKKRHFSVKNRENSRR